MELRKILTIGLMLTVFCHEARNENTDGKDFNLRKLYLLNQPEITKRIQNSSKHVNKSQPSQTRNLVFKNSPVTNIRVSPILDKTKYIIKSESNTVTPKKINPQEKLIVFVNNAIPKQKNIGMEGYTKLNPNESRLRIADTPTKILVPEKYNDNLEKKKENQSDIEKSIEDKNYEKDANNIKLEDREYKIPNKFIHATDVIHNDNGFYKVSDSMEHQTDKEVAHINELKLKVLPSPEHIEIAKKNETENIWHEKEKAPHPKHKKVKDHNNLEERHKIKSTNNTKDENYKTKHCDELSPKTYGTFFVEDKDDKSGTEIEINYPKSVIKLHEMNITNTEKIHETKADKKESNSSSQNMNKYENNIDYESEKTMVKYGIEGNCYLTNELQANTKNYIDEKFKAETSPKNQSNSPQAENKILNLEPLGGPSDKLPTKRILEVNILPKYNCINQQYNVKSLKNNEKVVFDLNPQQYGCSCLEIDKDELQNKHKINMENECNDDSKIDAVPICPNIHSPNMQYNGSEKTLVGLDTNESLKIEKDSKIVFEIDKTGPDEMFFKHGYDEDNLRNPYVNQYPACMWYSSRFNYPSKCSYPYNYYPPCYAFNQYENAVQFWSWYINYYCRHFNTRLGVLNYQKYCPYVYPIQEKRYQNLVNYNNIAFKCNSEDYNYETNPIDNRVTHNSNMFINPTHNSRFYRNLKGYDPAGNPHISLPNYQSTASITRTTKTGDSKSNNILPQYMNCHQKLQDCRNNQNLQGYYNQNPCESTNRKLGTRCNYKIVSEHNSATSKIFFSDLLKVYYKEASKIKLIDILQEHPEENFILVM